MEVTTISNESNASTTPVFPEEDDFETEILIDPSHRLMKWDTEEPIRILTYNIFIRPPGIKNNKSDYKDGRLKMFINNELDKWDVIAFQECFGSFSNRRAMLIKAAKKKGFKHYSRNPKPKTFSSQFVDGGLLILSRYPILRHDFVPYTESIQSDALASKGVQYAQLELRKGAHLHIFNTHMQATYNTAKDMKLKKRYESIRLSQLKGLRDFVYDKTKEDHHPIVLLGDFNVNGRKGQFEGDDSEEYLHMIDKISSPCFQVADILKEQVGYHPVTVGDVDTIDGLHFPRETHLTLPHDQLLSKRLDYIFWLTRLDRFDTKEEEVHYEIQPKEGSCNIFPFFVPEKNNVKFTQMSDHYGIGVELSVVKRSVNLGK